jgi:tRNA(Ile)-lysidine synthase
VLVTSLPKLLLQALLPYVKPGDRLLAAVSGGADSVALLHALRGLPFRLWVGHVDHRLRKGSAADARFVQSLARQWDLPFTLARIDVRAAAKRRSRGIEETAREMRYKSLLAMAKRRRCAAIVTAHHAQDQAETVLFNFLRGAGSAGLAGISPARRLGAQGPLLLRPFLSISRETLRASLRAERQLFREDPTNRDIAFTRNRIRHETLPTLSRDFPGLSGRLGQLANILRDEEDYWAPIVALEISKTTRQIGKKLSIDLTRLLRYHRALGRRVIRTLLPGLSFQETERIFTLAQERKEPARLFFPSGVFVSKKADRLVISANTHLRARQAIAWGELMRNV